ncbi:MAG: hypothetical protein AAFR88_04550 [Pseudomonadota bacterium]
MKQAITIALVSGTALALAACGSSDDASADATADTVEMPAAEALEPITEEPVADDAIDGPEEIDPAENAVSEETATQAAENAASVAEQAEAAAAEAEAAASAAQAAADAATNSLDTLDETID